MAPPPADAPTSDAAGVEPATGGPVRVLGIDPGLADVGWGVIEWSPNRRAARLVEYGVVRTDAEQSLPQRLEAIRRALEGIIERLGPGCAAVEQLYFARNVKTAMVVAHGRAACLMATARRGLELAEYTPLQIKQALTGHGRADKQQVQKMVRVLLGLAQVPRPDHAADALGAALCHVHTLAVRSAVARSATTSTDGTDADPRKRLLALRRRRRR